MRNNTRIPNCLAGNDLCALLTSEFRFNFLLVIAYFRDEDDITHRFNL